MRRWMIRLCCAFLLFSAAQLVHAGETTGAARLSALASWSTAKERSGTTPLFLSAVTAFSISSRTPRRFLPAHK